jgi:hypothetical protein
VTGACTEGIVQQACEGRWVEGGTCETAGFDPACGTHACCYPDPFLPTTIVCRDLTPAECTELGGSSSPGLFCVDISCPGPACINRPGDCFGTHAGSTGCDNALCCDRVCDADPNCCTSGWDSVCVNRARALCSTDMCGDALPISGTGTFPFDNTAASTDGPVHETCITAGGDAQIAKDVWYCWTSPCTDTVFVRTCGQTELDTKLSVYDGCTCPPSDANLLDCGDDRCGSDTTPQSTVVFEAGAGRSYLIRLGSYPYVPAPTGTGNMIISCGPPQQLQCPASAGHDCCNASGTATMGCDNELCCETVCGCDQYCCNVEWDSACATNGLNGSGCGAQALCPVLCNACPTGTVTFVDPPSGVVDARRPITPQSATPITGIDSLIVTAPVGADNPNCWSLCETVLSASPNGVVAVTDNGGGEFVVQLSRPLTPGTLTKVKYLGNNTTATLIAHPANVNGFGTVNSADVTAFVMALNGGDPLPWGTYSGDIDKSGMITPADLIEAIALMNGEGAYPIWNGTALPIPNANCP